MNLNHVKQRTNYIHSLGIFRQKLTLKNFLEFSFELSQDKLNYSLKTPKIQLDRSKKNVSSKNKLQRQCG